MSLSPGIWSLWLSQVSVHSLWSLCWCHWCLSSAWSSRHWSACRRLWRLCQDAQLNLPVLLPLLLSHQWRHRQHQHWQGWNQFGFTAVISFGSKIWLMRSLVTPIFLYACESWTLTAELQEEYKPWKLNATARYYTSHRKTMLLARKSVPRSSRHLDHTKTSWRS